MTIRDLTSDKAITGTLSSGERGRTYRLAVSRLAPEELQAIRAALDTRIAGSRIETSSWIPGADWRGTAYQPIYERAAMANPELAALMFGLFVWEAFERHPDDWYTDRFSMGGDEDRFRVYFKPGR
ncbi:hypothetical protein [Xanthobacter sp. NM-59]|uniref:hypothetical protein n=1 Tax=Xanthobacter sp. NM-59 TaxID=2744467 RepID=UPI001F336880|nr:hypothetical protein [Xanthobacter sp. NM-59]